MSHVSRASSGIGMSEGSSIHTLAGFGTRRCEGNERGWEGCASVNKLHSTKFVHSQKHRLILRCVHQSARCRGARALRLTER
jgi:hypothetical protein